MIARIWHGATTRGKSDEYYEYIMRTGVPAYRAINGNKGVYLLRNVTADKAEFLLISLWESYEAIQRFAGPEINKAVYFPEDRSFLIEMEPEVSHYEILVRP